MNNMLLMKVAPSVPISLIPISSIPIMGIRKCTLNFGCKSKEIFNIAQTVSSRHYNIN